MNNFKIKSEIETLHVCRICMEEMTNIPFFYLDFTQVNIEPSIRQKLSNCILELDLSIVRNAIICGPCADTINFIYNFKNKCLQSELQINRYIQQLQHAGDLDLAEVAQFNQLYYRTHSTELKTEDIEVTENFKYQETPTLRKNEIQCKTDNLEIKTLPVCRTCMEEISNTSFFHLEFIQVNTELTIRQKLSNCIPELDLVIVRNAIICSTCIDTINFVYNFKNKCFQSELQIHKYIQQLQHVGDVDLTEVTLFNQLHYRNLNTEFKTEGIDVIENFKYEETPTLLSYDTAFNHRDNDTESTTNKYLLPLQKVDTECVLFNYSNPAAEENLKTYDNSNILQNLKPEMVDNGDGNIQDLGYECDISGHKTKSKLKLILRMKSYTGKKRHQKKIMCRSSYDTLFRRYKCCLCNYLTNYKCLLGFHIRTHLTKVNYKHILNGRHIKTNQNLIPFNKINKNGKAKCSRRSYNKQVLESRSNLLQKYLKSEHHFSQYDSLKLNTETYMENKPFKCLFCEYQCRKKSHLKQHVLIHTGEKPFTCFVCGFKCRVKGNLTKHSLIHTDDKPFTCSFCEYRSRWKGDLKMHMLVHTGDKPFACSVCEFKCGLKSNLTKHMQIHTGDKSFACPVCEFKCRLKSSLSKHVLIHAGGKPFACSVCECKFKRKNHLELHMQIHTGEKQFTCSLCEYQCVQKVNLKRHMQIHTDDRPFTCSVCQHKSKCKSDLKKHIEIHIGEKRFACSVCDYRFLKKSNLKMHIQIHTDNKPFACSACEYRCTTKNQLKSHMLIHTNQKPFACSFCEYQCRHKSALKLHIMQNHTGEKPFACSVCEFQCTRKTSIERHMQIHTGNKPFACSACEYRCATKNKLKRHMLIHTDEKPFACSVCEYRCKQKCILKLHMQNHTGGKRFTCSVCEYQCTQKSSLKAHMYNHTGDKPFTCSLCEYQCVRKSSLNAHMQIHTGDQPFACSVCEYRCRQKFHLKRHMERHTAEFQMLNF